MNPHSLWRRIVGALVITVTVLAMAKAAIAADPNLVLDRIRNSGELRVPVMVGEEPGFIKNPQTGEWGGFYWEWSQDIATLLGVKLVPVETTWGNIAADFQGSKIDMVAVLNPNPKRGLVVDYVNAPLFTDAWAVVAKRGLGKKLWSDFNDPSVRIVVQKGSTMQVIADAITPKAQKSVVEERPLGLLEIQANRADAMVLSIFDALQVAKQMDGEVILPEPILRNPAMIAVRREEGNEGFMNFLANWTNQQRALGLAQTKLLNAFAAAGLDLSLLPDGFSF